MMVAAADEGGGRVGRFYREGDHWYALWPLLIGIIFHWVVGSYGGSCNGILEQGLGFTRAKAGEHQRQKAIPKATDIILSSDSNQSAKKD
ncbi:hypothetical protein HPP92_025966 [Vanilla planifolia]|uniref:Uncharacterized protein n=1 Tax=Vanilla planifolia TaxID=51239 RepID=A0A835PDW5_VANPL|nr:hypothetical protein HPP92_026236 [Vanilla planifolia]KAG0451955.1 hypothetical protein HPP92_025966 [Vanilla planifolia]